MNQWHFVLAAYGVVIVATIVLLVLSFAAMQRAEADIEALRER